VYLHHRIACAPRAWRAVATALAADAAVYGLWRSQIGRPRDELTAITHWPAPLPVAAAEARFLGATPGVLACATQALTPTLRPASPAPPRRQGNYAFRWFVTPAAHWEAFLALCAAAWPGFEAAYDSQVIGLWTAAGPGDAASGEGGPGQVRSLLLTRRPDLAMWERSKLPQGAAETAVRDALSRRYDLCDWTAVSTATLLTATDAEDTARWT